MRDHFLAGFAARAAAPGVRTLAAAAAAPTDDAPQAVRAGLLEVDAADLGGDLLEECFGPVTVLVRYRDAADAEAVLSRLGGNLTATLHAESGEPGAAAWLARLSRFAGRVIFGGWPTGVAVAPAMTHGGPYPATTTRRPRSAAPPSTAGCARSPSRPSRRSCSPELAARVSDPSSAGGPSDMTEPSASTGLAQG